MKGLAQGKKKVRGKRQEAGGRRQEGENSPLSLCLSHLWLLAFSLRTRFSGEQFPRKVVACPQCCKIPTEI